MAAARREVVSGLAFSIPAVVLLLAIHVVPLITLAILSFTDYELGALDVRWLGFENFARAMSDAVFLRALKNTLLYVAIVIPGSVILALLIALLVHARKRTRSIYEVIYFLPVTSTLVAMATVWQFLLHPRLGPINGFLKSLGFPEIAFLSEPSLVIPTLAVIGLWQLVGFNMILFLAGLSTIPRDLYDAAEVDGAGGAVDRFLERVHPDILCLQETKASPDQLPAGGSHPGKPAARYRGRRRRYLASHSAVQERHLGRPDGALRVHGPGTAAKPWSQGPGR
jgi:multiple sugar transport system permease protein